MIKRVRLAGVLLAGGMVLVAGCNQEGAAAGRAGREGQASSQAPTPTPTPTPTRQHPTLKPGARNADVRELQQRLKDLHYDPGKVDGKYGESLAVAVYAFQKVQRIKPTSKVGPKVWAALDNPQPPTPLTKDTAKNRVEMDLRRQVMYVYKDGQIALINHISSGSGAYYCAKDFGVSVARCRYASTQLGDFRTGSRASGWQRSPLGLLYNPIYFNGGIAMHGSLSVPLYAASHGCVRLPMHIADIVPKLVGTGVPVHVRRPR